MMRASSKPEPQRLNLYTEAGLAWAERQERREWLHTLVFVWVVSAAATLLLMLATGENSPVVAFALLAAGATAVLLSSARGRSSRAERHRRLAREVTERAGDISEVDAESILRRLHAQRRQVLHVAAGGAGVCVPALVAAVAVGTGEVAGSLGSGAVFLGIVVWLVVRGLRNLDRDFEQRINDTRVLLKGPRPRA
jgi:hypothetical protein